MNAHDEEALAWIGLGGNLGDVPAALAQARAGLAALSDAPLAVSSLYGSAAWGPVGGPDYVNQVVGLSTARSPEALLAALLALEARLGRVRAERWGPRTIDLDLLAHGRHLRDTPALTLPHPRLAERRFVLAPWAEIAPDWVVAGHGRTVAALLAACADAGPVWRCSP